MPKNDLNVTLKGIDELLFSTEEQRQEEKREQVQQIPIDELHPFTNHPFKVVDDEAMTRTVESIAQFGVLAPLIARPRPDGDGYEIISGHRRQYAAKLAGLETLPVIVRDMDDDAATILMVDSNLQREHISPSERAFAYKMKLDPKRDALQVRFTAKPNGEGVQLGSSNFHNVRANLKKALKTLSEGGNKATNVKQLIFITNSFNPFNDEASKGIFSGPPSYRTYDSLPDSSKKIIDDYLAKIEHPLDTEKLLIQTLPFETDDEDERYKYVLKAVEEFAEDLHLSSLSMGKKLMQAWQNDLQRNGSKKNAAIRVSKKEIIGPILVIITDIDQTSEKFIDHLDSDIYDEVISQYKGLITDCCEKYEFFKDILREYISYKNGAEHKSRMETAFGFVDSYWEKYTYMFDDTGIDEEVQEILIKTILYNVITKRNKIDSVKSGVNL